MTRLPTKDLEALLAGATAEWPNPRIGAHPTYRDCSFVQTDVGSANFFGPGHEEAAKRFASAPDLAREVIELRKALAPFAARAEYYDETNGDNGPELDTVEARGVTVGDCRRARALISTPEKEG